MTTTKKTASKLPTFTRTDEGTIFEARAVSGQHLVAKVERHPYKGSPQTLSIRATAPDGREVEIRIPNDQIHAFRSALGRVDINVTVEVLALGKAG